MKRIVSLLNKSRDEIDFYKARYYIGDLYKRNVYRKFVQRLVDKNMIDLDKIKQNAQITMLTHVASHGVDLELLGIEKTARGAQKKMKIIGAAAITMYAMVQDDPIEFLDSIIKGGNFEN